MSENNGMVGRVDGGAEGGTLSRGELGKPNQAAPGRFPETPCRNSAKRQGARVVDKGRSDGSSVQCERNRTGVQGCPRKGCWGELRPELSADGSCVERKRCSACGASWWQNEPSDLDGSNTNDDLNADACEGIAAEDRRLVSFAAALDAARSWARDWLDVYGQPTALWELLLRFAAMVAMRPGERRRLDEVHTVGLFEGEPGAMLWGTPEPGELVHRPLALVLPFGASAFGRPLPEGEVAELEATFRGAIQRVEALGAEAEFCRHAAGLIRGDCFSDRWTAGADFRDMAGAPLDGPHPDAYRFSLVGAMRQAWAERGGAGPLPRAYPERVLRLAVGERCVDAWRGDERPAGLLLDVLRTVNDDWKQTAKGVLELLTRAALAAEAEAESEVL